MVSVKQVIPKIVQELVKASALKSPSPCGRVEKRVSVFRGGVVFHCVLTPPQDFFSLRD